MILYLVNFRLFFSVLQIFFYNFFFFYNLQKIRLSRGYIKITHKSRVRRFRIYFEWKIFVYFLKKNLLDTLTININNFENFSFTPWVTWSQKKKKKILKNYKNSLFPFKQPPVWSKYASKKKKKLTLLNNKSLT